MKCPATGVCQQRFDSTLNAVTKLSQTYFAPWPHRQAGLSLYLNSIDALFSKDDLFHVVYMYVWLFYRRTTTGLVGIRGIPQNLNKDFTGRFFVPVYIVKMKLSQHAKKRFGRKNCCTENNFQFQNITSIQSTGIQFMRVEIINETVMAKLCLIWLRVCVMFKHQGLINTHKQYYYYC